MGQGVDALAQGGQVVPVAGRRVPLQAQGPEEADVPLQRDEILGQLSPVKGGPELQVDRVVKPVCLRRVGDVMRPAHALKGPGGGFWKVEKGVVGIEEQIGIIHSVPILSGGSGGFIAP